MQVELVVKLKNAKTFFTAPDLAEDAKTLDERGDV